MPLYFTKENRHLTAHFSGEIDHHSAKDFMVSLCRELDQSLAKLLTIDCREVSFMDSSAIAIFLRSYHQLSTVDGQLEIVNLPKQGLKVLKAAKLDKLLSIKTS